MKFFGVYRYRRRLSRYSTSVAVSFGSTACSEHRRFTSRARAIREALDVVRIYSSVSSTNYNLAHNSTVLTVLTMSNIRLEGLLATSTHLRLVVGALPRVRGWANRTCACILAFDHPKTISAVTIGKHDAVGTNLASHLALADFGKYVAACPRRMYRRSSLRDNRRTNYRRTSTRVASRYHASDSVHTEAEEALTSEALLRSDIGQIS
jgi:hypothetical protein